MRLFIIFLLFFGFHQLTYSQDQKNKLTLSYSNINRVEVIKKIEAATNYRFYFQDDWLDKNVLLSGDYTNKTIQEVLSKVFEDTNLNFFITKNKIILTNNSIINDTFENDKSKNTNIPIFFQQYDSVRKNKTETAPIALIGKETPDNEVDFYTLSGHITDLKDEKHLGDITVRVKNTTIKTTTNSEGFYSLKLPVGLATIEIESVLYNNTSRKIMIYSNGTLDFSIIEKINQLKEVLVKGKNSQNIRTAITGVTTIEAEGVKTVPLVLGERDVLKIALTLPGIKTAGEGSSGFNVRGGKEDQNLMLLDNGTIYNPAHLFGFFSSLNPYTINKVDIYKGGIPSEFGGRLSSVFDITSKNGNTEKFSGEGGIGPVTSNLTASIPVVKGKASLLVGGRATYSDWILKSLDEENLKNSQASFYDLFAKYSHKINKNNSVEGTGYYSKDKYSITPDSLYQYSNSLISLKWKHAFNEKNSSELNVSNSEYKFSIDYESVNPESFTFKYKINETQASLKFSSELNSKHKFTYGITSKLHKVSPGELNAKGESSLVTPIKIDNEKGLESAVFFSDKFKITEKLLLDIGARYSFYAALGESTQKVYKDGVPMTPSTVTEEKKYGNNEVINTNGGFEPRVALRYIFDESLFVKAGFDKNYQYIHLLTNNTTQSPTDTWKLSDLNVKPESGLQYSLGIFKKLDYNDIELSLEGYYKTSKNILDYKVGANLLLNKDLETELLQGDGKAYGIEFLLKKSVGRLNGWIGYTYSRTFIKLDSQFNDEKVNNGAYFPTNFDKPHDVSIVMNYKFTHRYSFSSNFVYQTGRPITYPIGKYNYNGAEYTFYSDRNKYRIPDYYRLDIGLNIEGNHKIKKLAHSFWNISIYNVLGRNNPYSIFFVTKEGQVKAYQTSIFSVPIPTITYNFKF
ncbi:outer membrane receptor protein involved in Fe transport [Flavobacterium araucananum]|uniref:TonB-dependent receptor n=1 Tax=Flavobacterium araucananum TaxID=946678 RepID=A0A227PI39_9FLAO|nr:carboxypeptidase-like regulatory domain-containing protein [Flavobacterium araucananum]OXG09502.1 TonB-dependent receptor [Flavobacterium araucananum]PWK02892.1 outer membrane receptor protein involved in Fe transport [Flavobacterium araucananum]